MSTNILALQSNQNVGKPLAMASLAQNVIRLRKQRGLSPKRLAQKAGMALFAIQQIEAGETLRPRKLPELAKALETTVSELDPNYSSTVERLEPVIAEPAIIRRDLPVYATTDGGDGTLVMSSDPVRTIDRPASLEGISDAYAVIIRGDSMGQIAPSGATVCVDPHIPARKGDLCIFRSQKNGDFISVIKELISETADNWRVKRYWPEEKEFILKKRDWQECHVVVTVHRR